MAEFQGFYIPEGIHFLDDAQEVAVRDYNKTCCSITNSDECNECDCTRCVFSWENYKVRLEYFKQLQQQKGNNMIDLKLKTGDWILARKMSASNTACIPLWMLVEVYDKGYSGVGLWQETSGINNIYGPLEDIWKDYNVVLAVRPEHYSSQSDILRLTYNIFKGEASFLQARSVLEGLGCKVLYKKACEDKRTISEVEELLKDKGLMNKDDTLVLVKE